MVRPPCFHSSTMRLFIAVLYAWLSNCAWAADDAYLPLSVAPLELRQTAGFVIGYSEIHEQAAWIVYELTPDEVRGTVGRTNDFRFDSQISTGSATLADYRGSGFDRGHLAPAGDMKWSRRAMSESFLLSNVSPQSAAFNRGIWRSLEEHVRRVTIATGTVYVATGPVFGAGQTKIGANNVAVPSHYWKVFLVLPEKDMVGYLLPHRKGSRPLDSYKVTVDEIEEITGLDLFAELPDDQEIPLEAKISRAVFSGKSANISSANLISINRASKAELESLPGIGPILAKRIIEGRPWRRIDELIEIKGIGPKRMQGIEDLISVK